MNFTQVLQVLYVIILLFILKQIYNAINTKRRIDGKIIAVYMPKSRVVMAIAAGLLAMMGAFSVFAKDYFGLVYIAAGLGFGYLTMEKILVYDTGLYYSGRFDKWEDIKKWSYDNSANLLEIETTRLGNKANRTIPLKFEDKDEILTIIKSKKNKKKSKSRKKS